MKEPCRQWQLYIDSSEGNDFNFSFQKFFTEEIIQPITDHTNIYEKENNWNDMSKKDIESFVGIIILMEINELPKMNLYWNKDIVFRNGFISSIISRDRFLKFFYNLHLADNSLEHRCITNNLNKYHACIYYIVVK